MRRVTRERLVGFSRQLKALIDKAQRLRDEINRAIIAATPPPPQRRTTRRTPRSQR